jgi:hypothetical protein
MEPTELKLSAGQKHLLGLIVKGANAEGWAPVSVPVFPLLKTIPIELIDLEATDEGRGRARLTVLGQTLIDAVNRWW